MTINRQITTISITQDRKKPNYETYIFQIINRKGLPVINQCEIHNKQYVLDYASYTIRRGKRLEELPLSEEYKQEIFEAYQKAKKEGF